MNNIDVIIFGGQSNMQGQSECLTETEIVNNAYEYKYLTDELVGLQNPVGENITYERAPGDFVDKNTIANEWLSKNVLGASCYGHTNLVPEFVRAYIGEDDTKVMAVHAAKGSTLAEQWLPGTPGYNMLVEKASKAIDKAKESYEIGRIFFVWLQGESDAIYRHSKDYYKEKLYAIIDGLKKDLGIEKFGIIRVGRFTNDERDFEIINAQDELANEGNDFVMLTRITTKLNQMPEYMQADVPGHYNAKGLELIGREAGLALKAFK